MTSNKVEKVFLILFSQLDQYSELKALLTEDEWQVVTLDDTKALEKFHTYEGKITCLALLNPINRILSQLELDQVLKFCSFGNSLIIASGANESAANTTNLNDIANKFGVRFNKNCIIRPNPYKQYHPKVAQLEDSIVNRGLSDVLNKHALREDNVLNEIDISTGPRIVYARGCTLKVDNKVSTIMMTSSRWAIPKDQAICSFYRNESNDTRVIAIGSAMLMSDAYIDKEDNKALIRSLLEFITNKSFAINISDAKTVEIQQTNWTPDTDQLINIPISCLQESEPIAEDISSLIERRMFNIDNSMLPTISRAFQDLNVKHEPLTLIKPDLECKQLDFEPATHGFLIKRAG